MQRLRRLSGAAVRARRRAASWWRAPSCSARRCRRGRDRVGVRRRRGRRAGASWSWPRPARRRAPGCWSCSPACWPGRATPSPRSRWRPSCGMIDVPLDQLGPPGPDLVVVCVEVRDPGNLGTIMRSAGAAGAGGGDLLRRLSRRVQPQGGSGLGRRAVPRPGRGRCRRRRRCSTSWGRGGCAAGAPRPAAGATTPTSTWPQPVALVLGNESHGPGRPGGRPPRRHPDAFRWPGRRSRSTWRRTAAVLCFEAARQRPGRAAAREPGVTEAADRTSWTCCPDAVIVVDEALRIIAVNDAACRLTGYGRHDLVGRPCAERPRSPRRGRPACWADGWHRSAASASVKALAEQTIILRRRRRPRRHGRRHRLVPARRRTARSPGRCCACVMRPAEAARRR